MTNLNSILKSKDITFLTKVCIAKSMVFLVIMYGCESWAINKAEHQRTDAFKLWCWRRLLRVSWTVRRSNQSILKEINPEYSLGGLRWSSNTLAPWYKVPLHWKRPWCWERLKAKGEEGNGDWDGWMALPTQWTWTWANSRRWWGTGKPGMLQPMGLGRVRHDLATEWQDKSLIDFYLVAVYARTMCTK